MCSPTFVVGKRESNGVPEVTSETIVGQPTGPYIAKHTGYVIYLDWTKVDVSIDPNIHATSDTDREAVLGNRVTLSRLSDQRIDRRLIQHARGRMYAANQNVTIGIEAF
jgi:hypothetical protein